MKRLVKVVVVLVSVLTVGAIVNGFTASKMKPVVQDYDWFIYTGAEPADANSAKTPGNYERHDENEHGTLCNSEGEFCAIMAPVQSGSPDAPDLDDQNPNSEDVLDAIDAYFTSSASDPLIRQKD